LKNNRISLTYVEKAYNKNSASTHDENVQQSKKRGKLKKKGIE
jgi:hypothetical protein